MSLNGTEEQKFQLPRLLETSEEWTHKRVEPVVRHLYKTKSCRTNYVLRLDFRSCHLQQVCRRNDRPYVLGTVVIREGQVCLRREDIQIPQRKHGTLV